MGLNTLQNSKYFLSVYPPSLPAVFISEIKKMSAPTWLPPLNSHETHITATSVDEANDVLETPADATTYVTIEEPNRIPVIPIVTEDAFLIDLIVAVKFFKNNNYDIVGFPGLCLKQRFAIPCLAVGYSHYHFELFVEIIKIMLTSTAEHFPFQLDPIYFREFDYSFSLNDGRGLVLKIMEALSRMRSRAFSNIIPLRWKILKKVIISDEEYEAWTSWYREKTRVDPSFVNEYMKAISRPRTLDELLYEQMVRFRAATASSVRALEVVKVEDLDSSSNCLVCLEDFGQGCEATRLPCAHVFHGDCIVRWLQESHMCPLCRFPLPTCVNN